MLPRSQLRLEGSGEGSEIEELLRGRDDVPLCPMPFSARRLFPAFVRKANPEDTVQGLGGAA